MKDLLLIAVPLRHLDYPPMSLALLKSILHRNGYDVALADANLDYWKHCGGTEAEFIKNTIGIQNMQARTFEQIDQSDFGKWTRNYLKKLIEDHKPSAIGLSIFSYISNLAAYYMGRVLRELTPKDTVLMVGGYGAASPLLFAEEMGAPVRPTLAETMKDEGTINTYILGDGEQAIVEFMKTLDNNRPKHIYKIQNFKNIPYPDYSDLELQNYAYNNTLTLPVTGSKGCVRRCTFCDIPGKFGKFVQRDGKDMAQECIHLYETYGAKTLFLTDSLVNGSMKAFMEFISTLAELKAKKNYNDIEWTGQYITRPAHQIPHNKDYYPLMAASGAVGVSVGAESGSNSVLEHMDKKMTVEDLFTELDYFRKYGISMVPNILPSYPTETREDFEMTIKMMKDFQPYVADHTIEKLGSVSWWYQNDGLNRGKDVGPEQGLYDNKVDRRMWWYKHNPELTIKERVFRRLAISKVISKLELPVALDENYEMEKILLWYDANLEQNTKWLSNIKEYREWEQNA